MKKRLCCMVALGIILSLSGCGKTTDLDTQSFPSGSSEYGSESYISQDGEPVEDPYEPSDPTDSNGMIDPNSMTADERRELLMEQDEENKPYYQQTDMSEERMEYRFNVYRFGLNFVNEHISSIADLYQDLQRNIFSYTDSARDICVTGTVEWCSRDGNFTQFLIKDSYAWQDIYFSITADTDVPVLERDTVTCFGYVNGSDLYTTTYSNGSTSETTYPSLHLKDMFIGSGSQKIADETVLRTLPFYTGFPDLSDVEIDFFFGIDAVYYNQDYISTDMINDHPYTVYGYYYEPDQNRYTCLIRYLQFEYPEGEYTTMTLSPYAIHFQTPDESVRNAYKAFDNAVPSTMPLNTNNTANGHMFDWYRVLD